MAVQAQFIWQSRQNSVKLTGTWKYILGTGEKRQYTCEICLKPGIIVAYGKMQEHLEKAPAYCCLPVTGKPDPCTIAPVLLKIPCNWEIMPVSG